MHWAPIGACNKSIEVIFTVFLVAKEVLRSFSLIFLIKKHFSNNVMEILSLNKKELYRERLGQEDIPPKKGPLKIRRALAQHGGRRVLPFGNT
jgi:hypothetical protein